MTKIGIASIDITPQQPVWLTGYGNRDHKSEGVYQSLIAGAISIAGETDEALILTADLIGYDLAYAAATKNRIAESTRLATASGRFNGDTYPLCPVLLSNGDAG